MACFDAITQFNYKTSPKVFRKPFPKHSELLFKREIRKHVVTLATENGEVLSNTETALKNSYNGIRTQNYLVPTPTKILSCYMRVMRESSI